MQSITLTQAHKSKLLEMCKVLFPEYVHCKINDDSRILFLTKETFNINKKFETAYPNEDYNYTIEDVSEDEYDLNFHWFEFCMTHLAEKILDNTREYDEGNFPSELEMFRGTICYKLNIDAFKNEDSENHPVDYLYNEFKKLKL